MNFTRPESQRDSVPKPRVARDELPWVNRDKSNQPQRGCGTVGRRKAATSLGLEKLRTTLTLKFGPAVLSRRDGRP